ncbi:MAG: manganese efflux pump MntP family protein [Candidatus Bathyarchaeota archaeon]|nr:manganese efflux pump MntP family protein [Candidatus Bathyarchaeota archaeon]
MDALTIILIAVGLAMDAFAVSIANGMAATANRRRGALLTATFFGVFQMLMPVLGWAVGLSLQDAVMALDHWIAFGLLAFIGGKMVYDGVKNQTEKAVSDLRLHALLVMAVATSIDALMVGFSFAFLQTQIAVPVAVIGAVTFGFSFVGFYFGCGLGRQFGHRIKIVGGAVLIIIGLRILLEHLLA